MPTNFSSLHKKGTFSSLQPSVVQRNQFDDLSVFSAFVQKLMAWLIYLFILISINEFSLNLLERSIIPHTSSHQSLKFIDVI